MFYQTESKPQGWRAVAVFNDEREECLLYLGRSSTQVRAGYVEAFMDILDEDEREQVDSIVLQRWHGAPDAGRWMQQTTLKVPTPLAKTGPLGVSHDSVPAAQARVSANPCSRVGLSSRSRWHLHSLSRRRTIQWVN